LVAAACKKTERLLAVPEDFVVKVTAKLHAQLQEPQNRASARQFQHLINLERLFKLQGQAAGTRRASLSEPLVMAFPAAAEYRPCSAVSRDGVASVACKQE
jgi:hypothetical protein